MMLEKIILEGGEKINPIHCCLNLVNQKIGGGNLFMHLLMVNLSSHLILTKSRANIGTRKKRNQIFFSGKIRYNFFMER